MEKANEEIAKLLDERRENALYTACNRANIYSIAAIRALHRKAGQRPHKEGGKKVIVLADVERLTPYEGSEEAANSLLKILEEPPEYVQFILTSSAIHKVLPTIKSRVAEIRLPPPGRRRSRTNN